MIDVIKRLAELDAKNPNMAEDVSSNIGMRDEDAAKKIAQKLMGMPNINRGNIDDHVSKYLKMVGKNPTDLKYLSTLVMSELEDANMLEDQGVAEGSAACGMSPMPDMAHPHTPASVNITAGSGEELSNMLKDIMSLAGVHKVEPHDLGVEPAPVTLTAEPMTVMGPVASAGDEMRAVIDRINGDGAGDEDDEEAKEGQYDNTPTGIDDIPDMDTDAMIDPGRMNQDPAGHPGVGDRMDGDRPKAFATMEESLMDEYKRFVAEDSSEGSFNESALSAKTSDDELGTMAGKQAADAAGQPYGARYEHERKLALQSLTRERDELKRKDMWSASDDDYEQKRRDHAATEISGKALRAQGHRDDR